MHVTVGVNMYLRFCVSLLVTVSVLVCVYYVKSEHRQKPCYSSQPFSKFDSLFHKTHSKVLPVLRYQGSTSLGP